MITPEVTLDVRALDLQAETIAGATAALNGYVAETVIPPAQARTDATLNRQVGAPHHPIDWQTPKQRAAYFASDGFGGGIPSVRTGDVLAWVDTLTLIAGGGEISADNAVPYAPFVFVPPFQQRMHMATGYMSTETYAEAEIPLLAQAVSDGFYTVNGVTG